MMVMVVIILIFKGTPLDFSHLLTALSTVSDLYTHVAHTQ